MKKKIEKQYCRYVLLEYTTGKALVCGEKMKDCSELYCSGSFLSLRGVVREYRRFIVLKGTTCLIVYWATKRRAKREELGSIVTPYGLSFGFRAAKRSEIDRIYPELVSEGI